MRVSIAIVKLILTEGNPQGGLYLVNEKIEVETLKYRQRSKVKGPRSLRGLSTLALGIPKEFIERK
jgi:hypothetical protein